MTLMQPSGLGWDQPQERAWVRLLSHELGGPVAVLRGYASMWESQAGDPEPVHELGRAIRPQADVVAAELRDLLLACRAATRLDDPALLNAFSDFERDARIAAARIETLLLDARTRPLDLRGLADSLQATHLLLSLLDQLAVALHTGRGGSERARLVELNAWARALVHDVAAGASGRGHRLLMDGSREKATVLVTPNLLRAAVLNLLDNAQKHSPAGMPIRVSVVTSAREVAVRIADRGAGFPPTVQPGPFRRVEQPLSFALPGLGLGLMIAARVAELNGGRLVWAPREGGGSEFAIELPRA